MKWNWHNLTMTLEDFIALKGGLQSRYRFWLRSDNSIQYGNTRTLTIEFPHGIKESTRQAISDYINGFLYALDYVKQNPLTLV